MLANGIIANKIKSNDVLLCYTIAFALDFSRSKKGAYNTAVSALCFLGGHKLAESEILNVNEAAKYLRISAQKVYQLKATDRTFPWHKFGENLRFVKDELKEWLIAH